MGFDWRQIWEIASAPDNVPIVALLFLAPFYVWYALKQGIENDKLIAILEATRKPLKQNTARRRNGIPRGKRKSTPGRS